MAVLSLKHAAAGQAAHDLLDEQRVAPGARRNEVAQRELAAVDRRAEQVAHERASVLVAERAQLDRRQLGARRARPACVGTLQDQQHHGPVCQLVEDLAQQVHRGRIGPLQIVDDQHDRLVRQPTLDQRARRQRDLAMQLLRLDVRRPGFLDPEQVVQHLRDRLGLVGIGAERQHASLQLVAGHLERIVRLDTVGLAEQRAEGAVGHLTERRAGGATHRGRGKPAFAIEPRQELVEQARLACTGLAHDMHELGLAPLHALECSEQALDRIAAADQRRRQPEFGEAARRGCIGAHPGQAMNPHWPHLAAHRKLGGRLEAEAVTNQQRGSRPTPAPCPAQRPRAAARRC